LKILITGGKSALALKLLKAFEHDTVIFADYGDVPSFFSSNYQFITLGERNDETLAHTLLSCCLDENIDVILPLHYFEQEPIIRAGILFQEFNVSILLPNITQLNQYIRDVTFKKTNWAIFENGEVVYSTQINEGINLYSKKENLNGAYYFEVSGDEIKLFLITILRT
jgi:hypothetical protein